MAVPAAELPPTSSSAEAESGAAATKTKRRSSILGSLRAAIGKVRFLLSFSATRWMLLTSAASRAPRRGISFGSPRPGLLDVDGSIVSPASSSSSSRTSRSASLGTATTRTLSRASSAATTTSPSPSSDEALRRTASGGSSPAAGDDDDIDRRAELFIANFYRQLRMERQVSLQLRYVRGNSWDRTPSPSPSIR